MGKSKYAFFTAVALIQSISDALAADTGAGIYEGSGVGASKLRTGDISTDDIPKMIIAVTKFAMGFAGTVSVVMIIYGAFKLSLGSIDQDKDTAKKIIVGAIIGFLISVSGWVIIQIVMTNL